MKNALRSSLGLAVVLLLTGCVQQTAVPTGGSSSPSPVVSLSSAPADDQSPIKLGFIGPLTGDAANLGLNAQAAVKMAVEEVNAGGGVNGRQIQVIYEDGKCNGKDASTAANKLINADGVFGIIGAMCSAETMAVAGLAEAKNIPLISYCSSAPTVTNAGVFIFRVYPSDTFQGKFAAEFARKRGYNKVAVLSVKTDYGTGIEQNFSARFQELGGTVVLNEGYDQASRDFRTQLAKVNASGADLLYFIAYPEAGTAGLKQVKEVGVKAAVLGGDAFDDPAMFKNLGNAADGVMYTVASSLNSKEFETKLQARTGSDSILTCSPYAYDTAHIFAEVLKKSGTDAFKFRDALYALKYTKGVSSDSIGFDKNGDVLGAKYVIKQSKGGIVGKITE